MSTLSLRLPDSLHEKVRELAAEDDISINQFIATAVAEKMAALLTLDYLAERGARGNRAVFAGLFHEATRSSSNTSGCRSASSRSRRAMSEGCLAPRSQARTVVALAPSRFANTAWDKPSRSRTR